jgi:peptide/nickel transport system substrate-binding protein
MPRLANVPTARAFFATAAFSALILSCAPTEELSPDEIAFQQKSQKNSLVNQTVRKPGGADYEKGKAGGVWNDSLVDDPKTFNPATSKDGESSSVIGNLLDALVDYDAYKKVWKPEAASLEIKTDEAANTMSLEFTLRDDLVWSTPGSDKTVKVTSDDVVFWYNEVDGDPAMDTSGYTSQFITLPDHTKKHIDIEKIDDRRFRFKYPEIVAFPELSSNMTFGPRYIFEPVKKAKGAKGVKELWTVDTDPKTIPSMGPYYLTSYHPGIGVTMKRNPHYWKRDAWGQPIPYIDTIEYHIVPNLDTEKLKFMAGELEEFSLRPQDMQDMIEKPSKDYTVYYGGANPGSALFGWNQNPKTVDPVKLKWFSNVKFRQALVSFYNSARVISQVYRDLASPATGFFPEKNPYYDPNVKLKFGYDPEKGKALLAEAGFKLGSDGKLVDSDGHPVIFDVLVVPSSNTVIDLCNIYIDELKKAGITMRLQSVDFQKFLTKLSETYDWDATVLSFGGSDSFPTQGSNVWPSDGDLHFWNPHQEKPATAWESRVDDLYHQGFVTRDHDQASKIWTEYQQTILDNVPVFQLVHRDTFLAIKNKWGNVRVDQVGSPDTTYLYLKD